MNPARDLSAWRETIPLVRKAARGVGLPWGLADQAAWAASWISQFGIDGPTLMANALDGLAEMSLAKVLPQSSDGAGDWTSRGTWLCPICTGASLADSAILLRAEPIRPLAVRTPFALVPFAAAAAWQLEMPVAVDLSGTVIQTDGKDIAIFGDVSSAVEQLIVNAEFRLIDQVDQRMIVPKSSQHPAQLETWRRLTELARRNDALALPETAAQPAQPTDLKT
ncbi:MAG: DUF3726 domain-containing protein [Pseudomonadota bacterium]